MVLSSQLPDGGRLPPRDPRPFLNTLASQEPKKNVEEEKLARESSVGRPPMGWCGAMGLLLGTVVFWCALFKLVLYILGRFQH